MKKISNKSIQKKQYTYLALFLGSIVLIVMIFMVFMVGDDESNPQQKEKKKEVISKISSFSTTIDPDEFFREKMAEDMEKIKQENKKLKLTLKEEQKEAEERIKFNMETFKAQLDQMKNREPNYVVGRDNTEIGSPISDDDSSSIEVIELDLTGAKEAKAKLKTVDTYIPAATYVKGVLLSGVDANTNSSATSDPKPVLIRMVDNGSLPRKFRSDLKDCRCIASSWGDLSSERVYARLEKLTCIERSTGEIVETAVAGFVSGSDGKVGIKGSVRDQSYRAVSKAVGAGLLSGLGNVANPANRTSVVNPFSPSASEIKKPSTMEYAKSGLAQGASSAMDRLAAYEIAQAEAIKPVIEVSAGQKVDIVFTEGVDFGSSHVRKKIAQARDRYRKKIAKNEAEKISMKEFR